MAAGQNILIVYAVIAVLGCTIKISLSAPLNGTNTTASTTPQTITTTIVSTSTAQKTTSTTTIAPTTTSTTTTTPKTTSTTTTTPTTTSTTTTTPTTTSTTTTTPTTTSTTTTTAPTTTSTTNTTPTATSTTTTTSATTTSTTTTTPTTTPTTSTTTTTAPTTISTTTTQSTIRPTTTEVTLSLSKGLVSLSEFTLCSSNLQFCENGGICYQNSSDATIRFCRCQGDYYGSTCESKSEDGYEKALYAMVLLAAILLMISVVTSCQLYVRKGDVANVKQEKHELEVFYQRKLGNSRTSTFNDAASSVGGISNKDMDISHPDNEKYLMKATYGLKAMQDEESLTTENKRESVVVEIADPQTIVDAEGRRYRSRSLDSDISLAYYYDVKDSGRYSDVDTNSIHSQGLLIPNGLSRPKSWCGSEVEFAAINAGLQNSDEEISPRISPNTSVIQNRAHLSHNRYQEMKNNRQRYYRTKPANYRPKSTSLADLRVTALNQNMRSPSRENLAIPIQSHGHNRKKGIWASSQERLNDLRDAGLTH